MRAPIHGSVKQRFHCDFYRQVLVPVLPTSIPRAFYGTMLRARHRASHFRSHNLCFVALAAAALLFPLHSLAQDSGQESSQEIIANLYAGRVVIGVAKDGIVVATLENPIEPETRPPMIVPLSDERVAILLGAGDWWLPSEHRELARLDKELPLLRPAAGLRQTPSLGGTSNEAGAEASDIEQIAERLHDRLNVIAGHIHGNLNFAPGEPLLQMILADYAPNYGPEVWLIRYPIDQEPEQGHFWQTTVLHPQYAQLWPPKKGQPRGLVEVSYPSESARATLAALIAAGDSRIAAALSAAPASRETSAAILNGGIQKLPAASVAAFLRESLRAIAPLGARMIEAEINKEQGIGWFIPPPAETPQPGSERIRPSGAPSLRHPIGKPPGPGGF
ncbi:MAG: hypothetical protein ACYDCD_09205 [Candidatus Acidiferrales bacterium]